MHRSKNKSETQHQDKPASSQGPVANEEVKTEATAPKARPNKAPDAAPSQPMPAWFHWTRLAWKFLGPSWLEKKAR